MARPRQVSDEQILAVMRARVLSEGPHVSLERVAKELEVSVPALLKRFGNRQALMVAALVPQGKPRWIDIANTGPDDRPLQTQLHDLMNQIYEFLQEAVPCFAALRESGIPIDCAFKDGKGMGPSEGYASLQRWLAAGQKKNLICPEENGSAAYALLGALQTRALHSHMMKTPLSQPERDSYIEDLSRLFAKALHPS